MFRIPYYYPEFSTGQQIVNLGQGGPSSHLALQAMQPRVYPTVYRVTPYGMAMIPPRQVIGPTAPINPNNYSDPLVFNNLEISGIFKSPIGS